MSDPVNSDQACSNCDTQQLKFENYAGCLCTIILDVELDCQERIINLLEDKQYFAGFLLDWAYTKPSAEDALLVVQTIIALIKGDQK